MSLKENEVSEAHEKVKRICREYSVDVMKSMIEICLNNKYPASTRVQSAQIILDRGFGKPKEDNSDKDNTKGSFISILRGIKKAEPLNKSPKETEAQTLEMFPQEVKIEA